MKEKPTYEELARRVTELETMLFSDRRMKTRLPLNELSNVVALTDELLFRHILDQASAVVFVKNLKGQYIYINARFETLHNTTEADVRGLTDYDLFESEAAESFRDHDRIVIAAGKPVEFDERVPFEDDFQTVISVKFPLFNTDGLPIAVCGIATDISERKILEDALKNRNLRSNCCTRKSWKQLAPLPAASPMISTTCWVLSSETFHSYWTIFPPKERMRTGWWPQATPSNVPKD